MPLLNLFPVDGLATEYTGAHTVQSVFPDLFPVASGRELIRMDLKEKYL